MVAGGGRPGTQISSGRGFYRNSRGVHRRNSRESEEANPIRRSVANTKPLLEDRACLHDRDIEVFLLGILPFGIEIDLLKAPKSAVGKISFSLSRGTQQQQCSGARVY